MQCPSCKETIDDDSRYCDQCSERIMVCSVCGRPGKGKRCIFDGKEMVPAGSVNTPTPIISQNQQATPVPVQTTSTIAQPIRPPPRVQPATQGAALSEKVKLTSQKHGIMIEAQDGDIIGRKNGAFASVFSHFSFVSGTHCKIVKTAVGWHIQDMGSTNGTFYNGSQLAPNALYPIATNSIVKIADIELLITDDGAEGGTTRL